MSALDNFVRGIDQKKRALEQEDAGMSEMKYWDVLIDTPNYEQWVYRVPSLEPPVMIDGCYVLDYMESEPEEEQE